MRKGLMPVVAFCLAFAGGAAALAATAPTQAGMEIAATDAHSGRLNSEKIVTVRPGNTGTVRLGRTAMWS